MVYLKNRNSEVNMEKLARRSKQLALALTVAFVMLGLIARNIIALLLFGTLNSIKIVPIKGLSKTAFVAFLVVILNLSDIISVVLYFHMKRSLAAKVHPLSVNNGLPIGQNNGEIINQEIFVIPSGKEATSDKDSIEDRQGHQDLAGQPQENLEEAPIGHRDLASQPQENLKETPIGHRDLASQPQENLEEAPIGHRDLASQPQDNLEEAPVTVAPLPTAQDEKAKQEAAMAMALEMHVACTLIDVIIPLLGFFDSYYRLVCTIPLTIFMTSIWPIVQTIRTHSKLRQMFREDFGEILNLIPCFKQQPEHHI